MNPYPQEVFSAVFPEFGRSVNPLQYGFYAKLAARVFTGCFTQLLDDDCVNEYLGLFTAHYLWTVCNMESGGTLKTVKGVNSAVTFESQAADRFTSNLGLSPYGLMLIEMAQLDYLGAGVIMQGVC